jgi:hypothetical protein
MKALTPLLFGVNQGLTLKRSRSLLIRIGVPIFLGWLIWLRFLSPLEGVYDSSGLDVLATPSLFVLKKGEAFVQPIGDKAILFGSYRQNGRHWELEEKGRIWILKRSFGGFVIESKADGQIHAFTRTYLSWKYFCHRWSKDSWAYKDGAVEEPRSGFISLSRDFF